MEKSDHVENEKNSPEEESGTTALFFDGLMEIWLPGGFVEMDPEQKTVRFPYRQKPPIIRADRTGAAVVTFRLSDKPLAPDQVEPAVRSLAKLFMREYPYNRVIPISRFRTIQGIGGSLFRFCYIDGTNKHYGEFFVLPIHGRLFVGTMSCPEPDKDKWMAVSDKIKSEIAELGIQKGAAQDEHERKLSGQFHPVRNQKV